MIGKYFAGFDLDKVFEEDQARLKKEKEELEARKRKESLEVKLKGRKKPEVSTAGITAGQPQAVAYKNVEFEQSAYREPGVKDKKLFYFDASLERLRAAGFERHARPVEAFSLLTDSLEGKLSPELKAVADDMLSSHGEFLSAAGERKESKFVVYFDPENLKWNGKVYVFEGDKIVCAETREYDITGKASRTLIDLSEFSDDFVKDFYGRSFNELPKEMQEGDRKAQVRLPPEREVWPVGRGGFYDRFSVNGYGYVSRASRGVRPRALAAVKV